MEQDLNPINQQAPCDFESVLTLLQAELTPDELALCARRWLEICRLHNLSLADSLEGVFPRLGDRPHLEKALVAMIREWQTSLEAGWQLLEENTRALEVANANLLQANRSRSEFISLLSHEIRTPLTVIGGAYELLLDEIKEDPHQQCLHLIHNSVEHIRCLIEDILVYAKLEAGMLELQLEPVDFSMVAFTSHEFVSPLLNEKGIILDCAYTPACVNADPLRLRQVLINLLSNAIKFSGPKSVITLRAQVKGPLLEVEVADQGIGIPPEDQALIFERFRQVRGRRTQGGTGLGLSICRYLVELHGGRITVESTPGEGSIFRFTLPLAKLDTP